MRHEGLYWTLAAYTYTLDPVGNRIAAIERVLPPTPHVYKPLILRNYDGEGEMMMAGSEGTSLSGPLLSPLPVPKSLDGALQSPLLPEDANPDNALQESSMVFPDVTLFLMAPLGLAVIVIQRYRRKSWAAPLAGLFIVMGLVGVCMAMSPDGSQAANFAVPSALRSPESPPEPFGNCVFPSPIQGGRVISYTYDSLGRINSAAYSTGDCY
ncbi:MAG: hypothetical protein JXA42_09375, partial [Anaerolineales bacterium]|nr:hypothetical protein [Anaerolineales bacterium]